MQRLADVVLDYFWFLVSSDEDTADLDTTVTLTENLVWSIENEFSDAERTALREAAARSLAQWLAPPDEHGYTPRTRLDPKLHKFLENIAAGRFNGDSE